MRVSSVGYKLQNEGHSTSHWGDLDTNKGSNENQSIELTKIEQRNRGYILNNHYKYFSQNDNVDEEITQT